MSLVSSTIMIQFSSVTWGNYFILLLGLKTCFCTSIECNLCLKGGFTNSHVWNANTCKCLQIIWHFWLRTWGNKWVSTETHCFRDCKAAKRLLRVETTTLYHCLKQVDTWTNIISSSKQKSKTELTLFI